MKTRENYLRAILQWGVIAAICGFIAYASFTNGIVNVEAYCPFGGLQALSTYLHQNSLPCAMTTVQIMMGVVLAVGVILFSRLFCSYLCPIGTVTEYLGRAGRKINLHYSIPQTSVVDKIFRIIKYVLLFVILYYTITTSELFCKKFDPYYAIATGFKGEIIKWLSYTILAVVVIGSIVFDMFWCRYICPLGAVSNIFKFTPMFAGMVIVCWVLSLLGYGDAWMWVLIATCAAAYLLEIFKKRSCWFPLMYIERDGAKCNGCGVCEKKCPNGVDITNYEKLRQVDCTLCGRCADVCAKDALQIKTSCCRVRRWVPAVIAVALVVLALVLGRQVELPTVDEKWGDYERVENLKTFEMSGLGSIKCFGSAKAFSAKMQSVEGVYGVKAYVTSRTVRILYDADVIQTRAIEESIFTPSKRKYVAPDESIDSVRVYKLGVEGLRDRMDVNDFFNLLEGNDGFYGVDAEFDCPVDVTLYVAPSVELTEQQMRDMIEVEEYLPKSKIFINPKPRKIDFELKGFKLGEPVSRAELMQHLFGEKPAQEAVVEPTAAPDDKK